MDDIFTLEVVYDGPEVITCAICSTEERARELAASLPHNSSYIYRWELDTWIPGLGSELPCGKYQLVAMFQDGEDCEIVPPTTGACLRQLLQIEQDKKDRTEHVHD